MSASDFKLKRTSSIDPDFQLLIKLLDQDLVDRYGELQLFYDQFNKIELIETVVVAHYGDEPVGCGCFKAFDKRSVEIKRMFVDPAQRGKGLASIIVTELENWARATGYQYTVLETGDKQAEAIGLYHKLGYVNTENYGQYVGLESSICMRKAL